MKTLFVCYGAGHVEMCLPVMRALRERDPGGEARVMALTTAHAAALRAGEAPLGYRDFTDLPNGARALAYGEQLLEGNSHPAVSREESVAYLGFNFLEWVLEAGEDAARARWREQGRQGFLPRGFFLQVLSRLQPDVVVATNSPRSEHAALLAARALGQRCLSMVDLFALPGDPYLRRAVHADRITVLAEATRRNLVAAGVEGRRIAVTGNPAFDALTDAAAREAGLAWRRARGWEDRHLVLWAGHLEPEDADPQWAGARLGERVQQRLLQWLDSRPEAALAIRYHPNEWQRFERPAAHPRLHWSLPGEEGLTGVLAAADQVVVQATTVGAQAHAAGKQVVALAFSPLVRRSGHDYARLGLAQGAGSLESMVRLVDANLASGRTPLPRPGGDGATSDAAGRVADEILALMKRKPGR